MKYSYKWENYKVSWLRCAQWQAIIPSASEPLDVVLFLCLVRICRSVVNSLRAVHDLLKSPPPALISTINSYLLRSILSGLDSMCCRFTLLACKIVSSYRKPWSATYIWFSAVGSGISSHKTHFNVRQTANKCDYEINFNPHSKTIAVILAKDLHQQFHLMWQWTVDTQTKAKYVNSLVDMMNKETNKKFSQCSREWSTRQDWIYMYLI